LKKEIRLEGRKGRAIYKVAALSAATESRAFSMRHTVRVPAHIQLRIPRESGEIRVLSGEEPPQPQVVKSARFWLIPIPPTAHTANTVLGAFVPEVQLDGRDGVWKRRITNMPPDKADVPRESTFLCLLDDDTRSYGAALQTARREVNLASPLVFTEEWIFEPVLR
jgi:hypothetical protein